MAEFEMWTQHTQRQWARKREFEERHKGHTVTQEELGQDVLRVTCEDCKASIEIQS